jgi:RNA polymerase sigma-70 factor (ECF subfamily)
MERNYSKMTDEILFSRFLRGDQKAFSEIMQRYQGGLYSLIYQSTKNLSLTEEVFQEVFYKVIHKKDYFDPNSSFKAWIYKICRNTCIDLARKRNKIPTHSLLFEESSSETLEQSDTKDPLEVVSINELKEFLNKAASILPSDQQETFYYKVRSEMTFEEIGEVMDCSINTAKSRFRYAIEKIREYFILNNYID